MDWASVAKTARAAFALAVNEWILGAYVQGGWVRGSHAELTPGSLKSNVDVEARVAHALKAAHIPDALASVLARELGGAWREWADGFRLEMPGAYPKLAAVPSPSAPPTSAATPYPLARASSAGEPRLTAGVLGPRLVSALRAAAGRELSREAGLEGVIRELATWVEGSFRDWKLNAQIVGVMGKGPIPSFAPPYVPVGPVVMGDNMSTPGQTFAGPRFGRLT